MFKEQMFSPSTGPAVPDVDYSQRKVGETIDKYQHSTFQLEQVDTFNEMSNLLDTYFLDQKINSETAFVRGSDMCQLLGLFFDLAEASQFRYKAQIAELKKYKTAYGNRLKREKKNPHQSDLQKEVAQLKLKNQKLQQELQDLLSSSNHTLAVNSKQNSSGL